MEGIQYICGVARLELWSERLRCGAGLEQAQERVERVEHAGGGVVGAVLQGEEVLLLLQGCRYGAVGEAVDGSFDTLDPELLLDAVDEVPEGSGAVGLDGEELGADELGTLCTWQGEQVLPYCGLPEVRAGPVVGVFELFEAVVVDELIGMRGQGGKVGAELAGECAAFVPREDAGDGAEAVDEGALRMRGGVVALELFGGVVQVGKGGEIFHV